MTVSMLSTRCMRRRLHEESYAGIVLDPHNVPPRRSPLVCKVDHSCTPLAHAIIVSHLRRTNQCRLSSNLFDIIDLFTADSYSNRHAYADEEADLIFPSTIFEMFEDSVEETGVQVSSRIFYTHDWWPCRIPVFINAPDFQEFDTSHHRDVADTIQSLVAVKKTSSPSSHDAEVAIVRSSLERVSETMINGEKS